MEELSPDATGARPAPADAALPALLAFVKERRAVDFSAYRSGTVRRRLALRLAATGQPDYAAYLRHLRTSSAELEALLDALTIKVSCFFRNPLEFEVLRDRVLPELLEKGRGRTLRIWCAGCARGEEPYSVAILLRELGRKEKKAVPVFILATDIDREALAAAREARYGAEALSEVRKGHLDRYFTREGEQFRLNEEIRSMVSFVEHDITTCVPPQAGLFSDYQLILCRNVLIYFDLDLQARVLRGFAGRLPAGGYLVLGEAETLLSPAASAFAEVLPGSKIFRKEG